MAAIREQVLDALFDLLDALRAVSPTIVKTVERDRPEPATADLCPLLVLHGAAQASVAEETDDHVRYTVRVNIEGFTTAATDIVAAIGANELYARTRAAIYADRTLGGLAFDMTEQDVEMEIDREEGHGPMAHFALSLRLDYQTAPGNPFLAP